MICPVSQLRAPYHHRSVLVINGNFSSAINSSIFVSVPMAAKVVVGSTFDVNIHKPISSPFLNNTIVASYTPLSSSSLTSRTRVPGPRLRLKFPPWCSRPRSMPPVVWATTAETPKKNKRYPGEVKGFVEEMRFVAMRLHTKDQAKEGEKEPASKPFAKLEFTIPNYLQFLVDSKLVHDTLEDVVQKTTHPWYAEFKNTGLERSGKLAMDLEWFKEQGHAIPKTSFPGENYALHLKELSENDPQSFICHFYNVYFAHSAGGRMIGKKVSEKILDGKELEFYKWDGELSKLLQDVRDKINKISMNWSREEKDHCLEQTEKAFKFSGEILQLILT